ncbi:hypothetical protein M3182_12410 [Mesobacillus maritimus]|uniref:YpoC family protein n=1 Tax=Mesobacillus maritimus TaxID=1643336 RepID=UPI00203F7F8F|nr:hypothetical protein [Mesobacillus maritimus]MCM3586537.1 hypothetical protein [Mesobacillus maritimus]
MGKLIHVPNELIHPYFFPILKIEWEEEQSLNQQYPFHHEIAYYSEIPYIRPWETPEKSILILLTEWKSVKVELEQSISRGEKGKILTLMKRAIILLFEFLFWTNKTPVLFPMGTIHELKIKPMNCQERIEFILSKPSLYHAFVQLSELFNEQEKHFMKAQVLAKKIRE